MQPCMLQPSSTPTERPQPSAMPGRSACCGQARQPGLCACWPRRASTTLGTPRMKLHCRRRSKALRTAKRTQRAKPSAPAAAGAAQLAQQAREQPAQQAALLRGSGETSSRSGMGSHGATRVSARSGSRIRARRRLRVAHPRQPAGSCVSLGKTSSLLLQLDNFEPCSCCQAASAAGLAVSALCSNTKPLMPPCPAGIALGGLVALSIQLAALYGLYAIAPAAVPQAEAGAAAGGLAAVLGRAAALLLFLPRLLFWSPSWRVAGLWAVGCGECRRRRCCCCRLCCCRSGML